VTEPVERLLARLERVKRTGPGAWRAECPAHEDRAPSLGVAVGDDGRALLTCRAGCSTAAVLAAVGLELADLFPEGAGEVRSRAHLAPAEAPRLRVGEHDVDRWHRALMGNGAALERLEELRGWTWPALVHAGVGFDGGRVVFPYRDGSGGLVGAARYAPNPERRNGSPKLKADAGSSRALFPPVERFPSAGRWLWLTEGEPDALRLLSVGAEAVAVPGTAGWRSSWADRFRGRRVVVCFDCDAPGREAAARVAGDLAAAGVDVRLLDLDPARGDGFDLSDWLRAARSESEREEARRLLERCAETAPIFYSGSKGTALPQRNSDAAELPFERLAAKLENVPAEPPWTWGGYLAPGAVTLLAGRPKAGKSTLTFGLMAALTEGRPFLDRETRRTGVLLLSEERPGTLASKADAFRLTGDVHALLLHEADGADWPAVVADAADYCAAHGLGVLVVDVLDKWARFRGDAENNAGDVNAAVAPLTAAAARGLAVRLVSHHRKAPGQYGEAVRGSNALTGAVDVVVELERPGADVLAPGGSRVLRAVSRWPSTPEELVARLDGDTYQAEGTTLAVRAEAERARVLEAVETLGEATVAQLTDDELGERAARRHLDELVAAGTLERVGAGRRGDPFRWRLVSLRQAQSLGAGIETGPLTLDVEAEA
jgi:hypothetical protein